MSLNDFLKTDIAKLNVCIQTQLHSDVALVQQVASYIVSAGGKRMRPLLLLLSAQAMSPTHPSLAGDTRVTSLAAVIEFIHTATLLHDDVVDESIQRRGKQTANALFGNAASVLVGDFLYSRAFQIMVGCDNMGVMRVLSDATNVIAEGEVLQLMHIGDTQLSEAQYLKVIEYKTAKLFEAAASLPAVLVGDAALVKALGDYGRKLGAAFQIIDDVLDYEGDPSQLGKNLGDDLREGKVTLPIIFALARATPESKQYLLQLFERIHSQSDDTQSLASHAQAPTAQQLQQVLAIMQTTRATQYARESAQILASQAIDAIASLPGSEAKMWLETLAKSSVERVA